MENRKKFLDEVAKTLEIEHASDWGKVTTAQVYELGGGSLLSNYYNGSLFACLQSVYKGLPVTTKLISSRCSLEERMVFKYSSVP